jgi:hypothetical protein
MTASSTQSGRRILSQRRSVLVEADQLALTIAEPARLRSTRCRKASFHLHCYWPIASTARPAECWRFSSADCPPNRPLTPRVRMDTFQRGFFESHPVGTQLWRLLTLDAQTSPFPDGLTGAALCFGYGRR